MSSLSAYRLLKIINFLGLSHKTIYLVIGGWFPQLIKKHSDRVNLYNSINCIYCEGYKMIDELKMSGITNANYLPNFKNFDLSILKRKSQEKNKNIKKFLYLSRVDPDKGSELVLDAVNSLNLNENYNIHVDFYGVIEDSYQKQFLEKINNLKYINYKGVIDMRSKKSYEFLIDQDYLGFLFCTSYYGEGFPGAIIDSMIMGLPVIATDWNLNSEIIDNNKIGFIIEPNNSVALQDAIKKFINNPIDLKRMKKQIIKKASLFHSDEVLKKLEKHIKSELT
jgi:glycosyltransferase involved in cell wall biosynthesis